MALQDRNEAAKRQWKIVATYCVKLLSDLQHSESSNQSPLDLPPCIIDTFRKLGLRPPSTPSALARFYHLHLKNSNLVDRNALPSTVVCVKCNRSVTTSKIKLIDCNHSYCKRCAADIVTESLSISNEIPKCLVPSCQSSLNSVIFHSLRFLVASKYQTPLLHTVESLDSERSFKLLSGFIRDTDLYIPVELIHTLHDFYRLTYHSAVTCDLCRGLGFKSPACYACNGTGFTTQCRKCAQRAITEICRHCQGRANWTNIRRTTGRIFAESVSCHHCDVTGFVHRVDGCDECGFVGTLRRCKAGCLGSGYVREICQRCNGAQSIYTLDFHKLCQVQLVCVGCGEYAPTDQIRYWSGCNHVHCAQCAEPIIRNEIKGYRIPLCLASGCNEELTLRRLARMGVDDGDSARTCYIGLKILIKSKSQFICSYCHEWHDQKDKFLWSRCQHEYGKECMKQYVWNSMARSMMAYQPVCIAERCNEALGFAEYGAVLDESLEHRSGRE